MCLYSTSAYYRNVGYASIACALFCIIEAVGCPYRKNCRAEGPFFILLLLALFMFIVAYMAMHLSFSFEKAMKITWADLAVRQVSMQTRTVGSVAKSYPYYVKLLILVTTVIAHIFVLLVNFLCTLKLGKGCGVPVEEAGTQRMLT